MSNVFAKNSILFREYRCKLFLTLLIRTIWYIVIFTGRKLSFRSKLNYLKNMHFLVTSVEKYIWWKVYSSIEIGHIQNHRISPAIIAHVSTAHEPDILDIIVSVSVVFYFQVFVSDCHWIWFYCRFISFLNVPSIESLILLYSIPD